MAKDECTCGKIPYQWARLVDPECKAIHHDETHGYHTADGEPVADVVERLNDYMNRLRQEREHTAFLEAENTRLRERIEDVRDCFHEDSDAWKNLTEALESK